jgi:hypothetical protein
VTPITRSGEGDADTSPAPIPDRRGRTARAGTVSALAPLLRIDTDPATSTQQRGWSQLVVVAGALACYEVVNVLTGSHREAALQHAQAVLGFERLLHLDWEHSVQSFTLHSGVLRSAGNGVYTWLYWPVITGALLVTWRFDRRRYAVLRDGMLLSGAVGLGVFIFYPVAPPRMLPAFTDTISPGSVEHAVVHGTIADSYAALPSFHVGWVALSAVILALSVSRSMTSSEGRLTAVLIAATATASMAAAIVVTANHFVLDAVTGIGLCLACGAIAARLHPSKTAGLDRVAPGRGRRESGPSDQ